MISPVLILVCVEVSVGEFRFFIKTEIFPHVLILVCVEVSVGGKEVFRTGNNRGVLILVCVEVSVGVSDNYKINFCFRSLNPCLCGS